MRLTPAQIAVRLICGEWLPGASESLTDRLHQGHDVLVQITGKDFGYDLQVWHEHLKESREGGYTYGRNIVLPTNMKAALESPDWREAVRTVTNSGKRRKAR